MTQTMHTGLVQRESMLLWITSILMLTIAKATLEAIIIKMDNLSLYSVIQMKTSKMASSNMCF